MAILTTEENQSLMAQYANAPLVRYEYRLGGGEPGSLERQRWTIYDYTATNVDPETARHTANMAGLQDSFDQVSGELSAKETQYSEQSKTFEENLVNLSAVNVGNAVEVVSNNFNFVLVVIIMYFLFGD